MIDGRECFDPNMAPLTEFSKKLSWPPTYIKCDCGEILSRAQRTNASFCWRCTKCGKVFSMVRGSIQLGIVTSK
ncbi:hypothetical protein IGI39_004826 [Enterococcus sp. AZ135]